MHAAGVWKASPPRTTGHAIEVRLNAEDPDNDFAPAPGAIERFVIRLDPECALTRGVEVGDTVPAEFDPMLAKIIAFGQNRKEALSRLQRVLRESVVVIKGGATSNRAFLLDMLNRPEVRTVRSTLAGWTGWRRRRASLAALRGCGPGAGSDRGLRRGAAVEQAQFYASALRGRPQVRSEVGHRRVALRGHSYPIKIYRLGRERYRVDVEERASMHSWSGWDRSNIG